LLFDARHETALRLFSGFHEGYSTLVIDLCARTLLIFNHSRHPSEPDPIVLGAARFYLEQLPWLRAVVVKAHHSRDESLRRGNLIHGELPDRQITENGIRHGIEMQFDQAASFDLDTRNLRYWAKESLKGMRVLNTFAYTGSLGVAALAGGAKQVIQLDANRRFLEVARESYRLNGLPISSADFVRQDFWVYSSRLRRSEELFDCVLLDPPFFARSGTGTIDLARQSTRLIDKVRPLVGQDGYLVAVNNALYLSGAEYWESLQMLCSSGYLQLETILPVPEDVAASLNGKPVLAPADPVPADPAPFNHPTKIAVLRARRKDGRRASS
jgi:23S rRNA (cytosine1962-C5)-methyltransferase